MKGKCEDGCTIKKCPTCEHHRSWEPFGPFNVVFTCWDNDVKNYFWTNRYNGYENSQNEQLGCSRLCIQYTLAFALGMQTAGGAKVADLQKYIRCWILWVKHFHKINEENENVDITAIMEKCERNASANRRPYPPLPAVNFYDIEGLEFLVEGFEKCCKEFLANGTGEEDPGSAYRGWAGRVLDEESVPDEDFIESEEHKAFVRSIWKGTATEGQEEPEEFFEVAGACSEAIAELHPPRPPSIIRINFLDRQGLIRIVGFHLFCKSWLKEAGAKEPDATYAVWAKGLLEAADKGFMKDKLHRDFVETIWGKGLKSNPVRFPKEALRLVSAEDRREKHLTTIGADEVDAALCKLDFPEAPAKLETFRKDDLQGMSEMLTSFLGRDRWGNVVCFCANPRGYFGMEGDHAVPPRYGGGGELRNCHFISTQENERKHETPWQFYQPGQDGKDLTKALETTLIVGWLGVLGVYSYDSLMVELHGDPSRSIARLEQLRVLVIQAQNHIWGPRALAETSGPVAAGEGKHKRTRKRLSQESISRNSCWGTLFRLAGVHF